MKKLGKCENCDSIIYEKYGSGRFCSAKCARSFSTKINREEINKKVSKTLIAKGNGNIVLTCKHCKNNFTPKIVKKKTIRNFSIIKV